MNSSVQNVPVIIFTSVQYYMRWKYNPKPSTSFKLCCT